MLPAFCFIPSGPLHQGLHSRRAFTGHEAMKKRRSSRVPIAPALRTPPIKPSGPLASSASRPCRRVTGLLVRREVLRAVAAGVAVLVAAVFGLRAARGWSSASSSLPPAPSESSSRNGAPSGGGRGGEARVPTSPAPVFKAEVVERIAHDKQAFTQGLVFHAGRLFESTGLFGQSSVREIDRATGAVLRKRALVSGDFGEGLTAMDDWLVQVLWKNRRGYVYDAETLERKSSFKLDGDAWGISTAAPGSRDMFMTNGSSSVQVLRIDDQGNVRRLRSFKVYDGSREVGLLNELQVIDGELWANVWPCDFIARIDIESGHVNSWLDLRGVLRSSEIPPGHKQDVLNGIAHDTESNTTYVTGKLWPRMYIVRPTSVKTASKIDAVTDAFFLEPEQVKYVLTHVLR